MSSKRRYFAPSLPSRLPLRVAILAALSAAPIAQAATTLPGSALDASEFLVNSDKGNNQSNPRVARDAAGDFVVVWESELQASSNSSLDIYAQRYNSAGQPQGSEFLVNTYTSGAQGAPAVAMDAAGDFVVAWESYGQTCAASICNYDIYARQYDAAGTALQANEFLVNTFTSNAQRAPIVAMDAGGDFVVVWESYDQATGISGNDIYARQYDSSGSALQSSEFLINTFTSNNQSQPAVAMDAAGDFAVAWISDNQATSTSTFDVYARQFSSTGTAEQASEFLVSTSTTNVQELPAVAMDAAGDFVIAWESDVQAASNSGWDVYARQYNSSGIAAQSSAFLVNTFTSNNQGVPALAMDAAGDFVVVWDSYDQASTSSLTDIYARQFSSTGSSMQTTEFLLNTFTAGEQLSPAVAMDAAGDFVAVWQSYDQAFSFSFYDIYTRRYQGPESVDLKATLAPSAGTVAAGSSFTVNIGVDNNTAASSYSNTTLNSALGVASGISAVFTLPTGVSAGTVSGTGWSCGTQSGTSLTCDYSGSLAAATASPDLTVAFTADAVGSLPMQVAVSSYQQDSNGSDNTASSSMNATDVAPAAADGSLTTTAGASVSGKLSATAGYSGQLLSFAVASKPGHGRVTLTDAAKGTFTYTPVSNFTGSDSFTFTAGDGTVTSSSAAEKITVSPTGSSSGGSPGTGSSSSGSSGGGGGGAFGLFSLALLGLPLRRRMRRAASRR